MSELYSYTEQSEFQLNVKAFEDQMEVFNLLPSWQRLQEEEKKSVIMKLLDQLEVSNKPLRMKAARCILYIAQGCWAEVQSDNEQQIWARMNVMMLYRLGVFAAFADLLNMEIENSTAAHVAMRKLSVSLVDSQDLRVIISVLYIMTEVMRVEKQNEDSEFKELVDNFCHELGSPIGEELLAIKLLGMVTRFCSGSSPHFPMKKVLLLLWKVILVTLGGINTLRELKEKYRSQMGLPVTEEDTLEIARNMRASSPPASASDLLEAQNQKRNNRPLRRSLMKQSSLDDHDSLGMDLETGMASDNADELSELNEYEERRAFDSGDLGQGYNYQHRPSTPTPMPMPIPRGLPWKPKVRQKDIDQFLENSRLKFVGFSLQGDRESLAGLPQPIHEGVKTLKRHMYTSLAELQIQKEEEISRNPISYKDEEYPMTSTEILYQAMLPNLPQYMIALLKILLAAAPTSKTKTDSINIMSDVLPEEMP